MRLPVPPPPHKMALYFPFVLNSRGTLEDFRRTELIGVWKYNHADADRVEIASLRVMIPGIRPKFEEVLRCATTKLTEEVSWEKWQPELLVRPELRA